MPIVTSVEADKPGTIIPFGGTLGNIPDGYLLCDGSAVSRTTYSGLYSVIGDAWGNGDGATTFHLPDLRGRFPRGVDGGSGRDPDVGSRTASNSGGNTGNDVGSVQSDNYEGHSHGSGTLTGSAASGGSHRHDVPVRIDAASGVYDSGTYAQGITHLGLLGTGVNSGLNPKSALEGSHSHSVSVNSGSTATVGGNETRPQNANVYFIIKV